MDPNYDSNEQYVDDVELEGDGDEEFLDENEEIMYEYILDDMGEEGGSYAAGTGDDDDMIVVDNMEDDEGEEGEYDGPNDSLVAYTEHTDSIYSVDILEQNDGVLVVTGSGDDTARIWKLRHAAAGSSSGSGLETYSLHTLSGHKDSVIGVQFSHDGQYIATGGMDGLVGIWYTSDGTLQRWLEGPSEAIEWIQWHPKAHVLLCGSAEATCWLYNAKSGKPMNVFAGHSGSVSAGCFTSDGKLVLTGSEDGTVRLWSPNTGYSVYEYGGSLFSYGGITCVESKPDDANVFVSTAQDGFMCVGHTGTGRILHKFAGHDEEQSIETAAFCPISSNLVATGGMDKKILLWDIGTQQLRGYLLGHTDGIIKIQFDKRYPLIYSCSVDKTVNIWDYRNGQIVKTLRGHRNNVLDFALTSDSSLLITASDDAASLVFSTAH